MKARKEPYAFSKEPCVFSKEPYVFSAEPDCCSPHESKKRRGGQGIVAREE